MATKTEPKTNSRKGAQQVVRAILDVPERGEPAFKNITMTPELATELLNHNTRNRVLSESNVYKYAKDMREGRWKRTAEPISIDWNGDLLNGQHRLYACVESGCSFRCTLAYGLDPDAFSAIDRGKARTIGDTFGILGHKNAHLLAASITKLVRHERGVLFNTNAQAGYVNVDEAKEALARHPDIKKSCKVARRARADGVGSLAPPSLLTLMHYLFSRRNAEAADSFFAELGSGTNLTETDGVLHLRNRLIRNRLNNKADLRSREIAALTIKAWNARRNGKKVRQLRFHSRESYPEIG